MREPESLAFRPKARLLVLLGDQLIRNAMIAVFELVKNAYDADATECHVLLKDIEQRERARIVITDNGTGMDWNTVTEVWLVPATDHRLNQRARNMRTERLNRRPLGEKGIGRFASHKLGSDVKLITRMADKPEVVVSVDWKQFESGRFLDQIEVSVNERKPEVFKGKKSGTRIEISRLRERWTRGKVRHLYRSIMSICSPFEEPSDFKPTLEIDPDEGWLDGLIDVQNLLKSSLFRATCRIEDNQLSYRYEFTPPDDMTRLNKRSSAHSAKNPLVLPSNLRMTDTQCERRIGPFDLRLHIWDRGREILPMLTDDVRGLQMFLDENGGIRVYRDGMRVYDYGERGNDWLDLGGRRVNIPADRLSNNIVVGAIHLDSERSDGLVEKTNREGFIENDDYESFREAVLYAIGQIENERNVDKERIRRAYSSKKTVKPVLDEIRDLRGALEERDMLQEFAPYIDRLEDVYIRMREVLLTSAGSGLALLTVIHELERGVGLLSKSVERGASRTEIGRIAKHLSEILDGITLLAKKSHQSKQSAGKIIQQAIANVTYRLRVHEIEVIDGIQDCKNDDFEIRCSRRLIVATLMNLVDNSIFWLDDKGGKNKRIFIGSAHLDGRPAIVVSDNGPGFSDSPEMLVQPFWSRKPDGMGLGLYIANEIMKSHGGRLAFPSPDDVALPKDVDQAVVALVFEGTS